MLPGSMTDDKVKIVSPEFNSQDVMEVLKASKDNKLTKKHALIAVTCVFVSLVLVAGFLGGAFMFKSAAKDVAQFRVQMKDKETGNDVTEDVTSDRTDNVVEYHMHQPGMDQWVLHDFNKDLTVYKMKTSQESICYVTPLNETEANRPEAVRENMNNMAEDAEDNDNFFKTADEPITDSTFLGKKINDLCQGIDIYWVFPSCPDSAAPEAGENAHNTTEPATADRSKRLTWNCRYGCCYNVCGCNVRGFRWVLGGRQYCRWIYNRRCRIRVYRSARYC